MVVSLEAMLMDIVPVLISAFLSALIWNFFFIPPIFTFHIDHAEDVLMFFLYFIIALVNAVLTSQIRKEEKKSIDKKEKENTIKLYSAFFNSLSHELRTPISSIISAIDMLKDNFNTFSLEKNKEILGYISSDILRLNKQVHNMLNMSRLESGHLKLKLEWLDINDLINSAISKTRQVFDKCIIIFDENKNIPLVKLDNSILEQAVINILINAFQHNEEKINVQINAFVLNNFFVIEIEDNGTGIPEDNLLLIFNKFYRSDETRTGGTGLGLSISKGFIEALNGTLDVENVSPHGLKFTIKIKVEIKEINKIDYE